MSRWTKAHTFAEKLTKLLSEDGASFDAAVALMQQAIDYGCQRERRAALNRLQKTYDAGGFEGGSLTSWGNWEVAAKVIKGEIVRSEAEAG